PERMVDDGALQVHGITNEFLKEKPVFNDIVNDFVRFIDGAELIIHNAPFDIGFIRHELRLTKKNFKEITEICRIVDTLVLARQIHMGQRNSLDALCKRYSIDNTHRELHGALMDAHLLAQVYLAMTGGQSSLFGDLQTTKTEATEKHMDIAVQQVTRNLVVLHATEEELIAHQEHLEILVKKGRCVWQE
ncbi:MAG TPA: DNA polymerase III subunit epsilon, partial [Gammaproteobacteria bacterium]|nr:DNA polymerase III subunit epsilon [Gammaproteobacteria bacterium]